MHYHGMTQFISKTLPRRIWVQNGFLNKDYPEKFIPYEDEPKIVGLVVGHFMPVEEYSHEIERYFRTWNIRFQS